jgi:hypothetical protein
MEYKYFTILLLLSLAILTLYFSSFSALADSKVIASPLCGSEEGFNMKINGTDFVPNAHISWVILDTTLDPKLNGYFATDNSGSFNEVTFADDLPIGKYSMFFFDDREINYKLDNEESIYKIDLEVPCPNK